MSRERPQRSHFFSPPPPPMPPMAMRSPEALSSQRPFKHPFLLTELEDVANHLRKCGACRAAFARFLYPKENTDGS